MPRSIEQIRKDHKWLRPIAKQLHETFGGYSGLIIKEQGEVVYSWAKDEKRKRPTNLLPRDRRPHRWADECGD